MQVHSKLWLHPSNRSARSRLPSTSSVACLLRPAWTSSFRVPLKILTIFVHNDDMSLLLYTALVLRQPGERQKSIVSKNKKNKRDRKRGPFLLLVERERSGFSWSWWGLLISLLPLEIHTLDFGQKGEQSPIKCLPTNKVLQMFNHQSKVGIMYGLNNSLCHGSPRFIRFRC